jgi:hypothetical protein
VVWAKERPAYARPKIQIVAKGIFNGFDQACDLRRIEQ